MTGSLAFATDVALLRGQGAVVERTPEATVVRMPANPTFRWGNFLLVDAAGDPAERVSAHAAAFPGAGFTAIGVDAADPRLDERSWTAAGFEVARLAVLTATAPPPAPDVPVRTTTSDADWADETAIVLEVSDDAEHVGFVRRRNVEKRMLVDGGRAAWLGVEQGGRLVATAGIADAGDGTARFQDVQTAEAYRRRGFAGALIAAGAHLAAERFGSDRFVLVAERDGPAIGLYRRLGFVEQETQLQLTRIAPTVEEGR